MIFIIENEYNVKRIYLTKWSEDFEVTFNGHHDSGQGHSIPYMVEKVNNACIMNHLKIMQ